jgi:LDH2 family malate/lactate/ureidoglycolate dehydrogenase
MTKRYDVRNILELTEALFARTGMRPDAVKSIARCLVTADMMGHSTHGLAIAPWYLEEVAVGNMKLDGEPIVVTDRGGCFAWSGNRLPGAWLIDRAIDQALTRVAEHGVVTGTIANSHHTGALATYLPRITERGYMVVLTCSGPAHQGVAPYGGARGVFTPNPLAAGIPSHHDPILLDISCSITTIKRTTQFAQQGKRLPGAWVVDAEGNATDDPNVLLSGNGTLLPTGGLDHGHKGYAMALLVESLTQGLSGYGRRDKPQGITMNTFLQIIDPSAFGGKNALLEETDWLIDACHQTPPLPGFDRVRVPGDLASERMRLAQREGVALSDVIIGGLLPYAKAYNLVVPEPLN